MNKRENVEIRGGDNSRRQKSRGKERGERERVENRKASTARTEKRRGSWKQMEGRGRGQKRKKEEKGEWKGGRTRCRLRCLDAETSNRALMGNKVE